MASCQNSKDVSCHDWYLSIKFNQILVNQNKAIFVTRTKTEATISSKRCFTHHCNKSNIFRCQVNHLQNKNSIMAFVYQGDPELESKSRKAAERISENMHIVANEPSLALYRLQEHVRKALPPMVERRVEVTKLQHELQGRCYDVEYALSAVKSMDGAATSFKNIQEMLKQSIFLKQQLKYEEARRNKKDSNSVYKRLSAHIVLDLPDLSEFSMVRETTNRIENMMAQARGSSAELHRSHTTLH